MGQRCSWRSQNGHVCHDQLSVLQSSRTTKDKEATLEDPPGCLTLSRFHDPTADVAPTKHVPPVLALRPLALAVDKKDDLRTRQSPCQMVATPSHCSYLMSDTNIGGLVQSMPPAVLANSPPALPHPPDLPLQFPSNSTVLRHGRCCNDSRTWIPTDPKHRTFGKVIVDLSQNRSVNGNIDNYWENHSTFLGVSQHPPNWAGSMEQRFPAVWQSEGRSNESALVPALISRRSSIERVKITQLLQILINLPLQSCSVRGGKVTIAFVLCSLRPATQPKRYIWYCTEYDRIRSNRMNWQTWIFEEVFLKMIRKPTKTPWCSFEWGTWDILHQKLYQKDGTLMK